MGQCSSDPRYSCIGPGGSCDSLRSGCAHAKKDREDEERDRKAAGGGGGDTKIGFWGCLIIAVIALYLLGK
jgi:hypothetical protein